MNISVEECSNKQSDYAITTYEVSAAQHDIYTYVLRRDRAANVLALSYAPGVSEIAETASAMAAHLFISNYRYWLKNIVQKSNNRYEKNQHAMMVDWLRAQVRTIHDYISDAASLLPECSGMVAQLCGVISCNHYVWIVCIGEAQIYFFDQQKKVLECISASTEAMRKGNFYGLGKGDYPQADILTHRFQKSQAFILCPQAHIRIEELRHIMNGQLSSLTNALTTDTLDSYCVKNGSVPIVLFEK